MRVQYIVNPENQILVRARTPGPHRIDATDRNQKELASTCLCKELVKQDLVAIASPKIFWNCRYRI
jgi:hypothetical protein